MPSLLFLFFNPQMGMSHNLILDAKLVFFYFFLCNS
uniref:Uncharacterized protein n=1 Tax=Rhizophora mucronata TaxID=61149 RepID=A0A2P2JUV8_RHIMU